MSRKINIHVSVTDPVCARLLTEQLSGLRDIGCDLSAAPDIVIGQKELEEDVRIPFRLGEWVDRLRYRLSGREKYVEESAVYMMGDFGLYADRNMLVHEPTGEEIRLTDKERLLLRTLYDAPERKESREALLDRVWGYARGTETHTLETHLYRLRQKLEPFGAQDLIRADGQGNYSLDI